jgi:hypothetical protein
VLLVVEVDPRLDGKNSSFEDHGGRQSFARKDGKVVEGRGRHVVIQQNDVWYPSPVVFFVVA